MNKYLILLSLILFGCSSSEPEMAEKINTTTVSADASPPEKQVNEEIQNGDLIFHTSTSNQSLAIQIASKSKYSHVGIIYRDGADYLVLEAVEPVKVTPLKDFIKRGEGGHYVVKRLKTSEATLTPAGVEKMKEIGKQYINKNYDLRFEWSDDKIYCSELVWKIYKQAFDIEIGKLQQIKDFDLSDPIVQAKARERYGDNIPMEELIITPDRMFQSDKLITVLEK